MVTEILELMLRGTTSVPTTLPNVPKTTKSPKANPIHSPTIPAFKRNRPRAAQPGGSASNLRHQ